MESNGLRQATSLALVLLLTSTLATAAEPEMCGDWYGGGSTDAFSDDTVELLATSVSNGGDKFGLRCYNGREEIVFLEGRGTYIPSHGSPVRMLVRVDKGEVRELRMKKATGDLWLLYNPTSFKQLVDEFSTGSSFALRFLTPVGFDDKDFAGTLNGFNECAERVDCIRALR